MAWEHRRLRSKRNLRQATRGADAPIAGAQDEAGDRPGRKRSCTDHRHHPVHHGRDLPADRRSGGGPHRLRGNRLLRDDRARLPREPGDTDLRCLARLLRSAGGGEEQDRRVRSRHGRVDAFRAGQGGAGGNAGGRTDPRSEGDPGLRTGLLRRSVARTPAGPRARVARVLRIDVGARGDAAKHLRHCTGARPGVPREQVPGTSLVIARDRLPRAVGAAGTGAAPGRGAFRLRSTDDTAHRRRARRPAGANACRSLERRTAHLRLARRQHRRRDDALDQRPLGLDAAPHRQPAGEPGVTIMSTIATSTSPSGATPSPTDCSAPPPSTGSDTVPTA